MKAKLSKHFRDKLDPVQQQCARDIIRHLNARANYPNISRVASAYSRSLNVSVDKGRIVLRSGVSTVLNPHGKPSVGAAVCEAVYLGVLPENAQQADTAAGPEPDAEPEPDNADIDSIDNDPVSIDVEPEPEPEPEPTPEPVVPKVRDAQEWTEWVYTCREYFHRGKDYREHASDDAGMRPVIDGLNMIEQGIPLDACKDTYLLTNDEAVRSELGVRAKYRPEEYGGYDHDNGPLRHKALGYILALIRAGVPVWLSGPAGTGKSTLGEHVAEELGRQYRSLSLTGGASPAWVTGRETVRDFVNSGFGECYEDGGVYLLDEVANGSPDLLTTLNNAIAGDIFENPVSGRKVPRSDLFALLASDNSWGQGDEGAGFVRRALDTAFLDRFRMGRTWVDHDRRITDAITAAKIERMA